MKLTQWSKGQITQIIATVKTLSKRNKERQRKPQIDQINTTTVETAAKSNYHNGGKGD